MPVRAGGLILRTSPCSLRLPPYSPAQVQSCWRAFGRPAVVRSTCWSGRARGRSGLNLYAPAPPDPMLPAFPAASPWTAPGHWRAIDLLSDVSNQYQPLAWAQSEYIPLWLWGHYWQSCCAGHCCPLIQITCPTSASNSFPSSTTTCALSFIFSSVATTCSFADCA